MPKLDNGLTDKQQAFVYAYLSNGFNATQAAITAGYPEKAAYKTGWENLRKPQIAIYIKQAMTERAMPAYEVLARIAEQARGTMEDFLNESGEIDLERARSRGKLHLIKTRSKTTTLYGGTDKVELYSAQSALELLAKHHALLTENVNLSGEVSVKGYVSISPDEWDAAPATDTTD